MGGANVRHGRCFDEGGAPRSGCGGIVVEKMHLSALAFGGENSTVAPQYRKNNFLFIGLDREINRK
jgi:hypothetical protein